MAPVQWQYVVVVTGCVVGLGALMWYLTREEPPRSTESRKLDDTEATTSCETVNSSELSTPFDSKSITEGKVKEILQEILESQTLMRSVLKSLAQDIKSSQKSFDDVYEMVKSVQPDDPLEKRGITMAEFDVMLERFHNSSEIRELLTLIMCSSPSSEVTSDLRNISSNRVVEVHEFMLLEVKKAIEAFHAAQKKKPENTYDMKTVTIAVQAMVGAETDKKYHLSSEEIEGAVLLHHQTLCVDPKFSRINLEMQSVMSGLMGLQQGPGMMEGLFEGSGQHGASPADFLLLQQQQHQQQMTTPATLAKS